jgi:hypothetical protein
MPAWAIPFAAGAGCFAYLALGILCLAIAVEVAERPADVASFWILLLGWPVMFPTFLVGFWLGGRFPLMPEPHSGPAWPREPGQEPRRRSGRYAGTPDRSDRNLVRPAR